MTVVVADTSPVNYLVLIGEIGILERPYGRIVIPEEVFRELTDGAAPPEVREWAGQHPKWLEVRVVPAHDSAVTDLDAGEAAAIGLAERERDVLLLIDESAGRREASKRGIPNTGTLGVLLRTAVEDLVDLPSALSRRVGHISERRGLWSPVFSPRTRSADGGATEISVRPRSKRHQVQLKCTHSPAIKHPTIPVHATSARSNTRLPPPPHCIVRLPSAAALRRGSVSVIANISSTQNRNTITL